MRRFSWITGATAWHWQRVTGQNATSRDFTRLKPYMNSFINCATELDGPLPPDEGLESEDARTHFIQSHHTQKHLESQDLSETQR
jgi:hypothetical protein